MRHLLALLMLTLAVELIWRGRRFVGRRLPTRLRSSTGAGRRSDTSVLLPTQYTLDLHTIHHQGSFPRPWCPWCNRPETARTGASQRATADGRRRGGVQR